MNPILRKVKVFLEDKYGIEIKNYGSSKLMVNQAVNFDLESIFIAVPKTGTTSVRSQMTQVGKPIMHQPHLNIMQVRQLIYVYHLKTTIGRNFSFPNPDWPTDQDLWKKTDELIANFFKFSAVRNPWARAVSLYFRHEGQEVKDLMSFESFIEQHTNMSDTSPNPTRHQNQLDWLCDEKGNNMMDYTYKVEDFDQAIQDIREMSNGRIVLKNVQRNKNPQSKSQNYRQMYNDRTKQLIAKHFEKDIDTFKYVF